MDGEGGTKEEGGGDKDERKSEELLDEKDMTERKNGAMSEEKMQNVVPISALICQVCKQVAKLQCPKCKETFGDKANEREKIRLGWTKEQSVFCR